MAGISTSLVVLNVDREGGLSLMNLSTAGKHSVGVIKTKRLKPTHGSAIQQLEKCGQFPVMDPEGRPSLSFCNCWGDWTSSGARAILCKSGVNPLSMRVKAARKFSGVFVLFWFRTDSNL